jgi:hypothetical protein
MLAALRVALVAILTGLLCFALDRGVNACVYPFNC